MYAVINEVTGEVIRDGFSTAKQAEKWAESSWATFGKKWRVERL